MCEVGVETEEEFVGEPHKRGLCLRVDGAGGVDLCIR